MMNIMMMMIVIISIMMMILMMKMAMMTMMTMLMNILKVKIFYQLLAGLLAAALRPIIRSRFLDSLVRIGLMLMMIMTVE